MSIHRTKVKALRERMGHTQEDFAGLFPVAVKTVSRWELGEVAPSPMARAKMQELARKHRADNTTEEAADSPAAPDEAETSELSESTVPRRRGILPSQP